MVLENELPAVKRRWLDLKKAVHVPAAKLLTGAAIFACQQQCKDVPIERRADRRIRKLIHTFSSITFACPLESLLQAPACDNFYGFNQQFIRASLFLTLINELSVDAFWETGSFMGDSSLLIAAQTGLPIYSCELNQQFFESACKILKPFGDRIHICNQDSRAFLNDLIGAGMSGRPFIYLDAHWYDDLPLLEEIKSITSSGLDFVVAVDDFKVPGDQGFSYDQYQGQPLDWEYIAPVASGLSSFYPGYPGQSETAYRRGFILLATPKLAEMIERIVPSKLLRRAN